MASTEATTSTIFKHVFNHVGFLSDSGAGAGGAGRDRVDAVLPQLPQKSASGWSFPPHFLQNIVALPLPVYASQPFEVLGRFDWLFYRDRNMIEVAPKPKPSSFVAVNGSLYTTNESPTDTIMASPTSGKIVLPCPPNRNASKTAKMPIAPKMPSSDATPIILGDKENECF